VDRKDAARPANGFVHVEMDAQSRLVARIDLGAADGAVAREVALAADALALRRAVFLEPVLVELLGPVRRSRASAAILAQRSSNLLLFLPPPLFLVPVAGYLRKRKFLGLTLSYKQMWAANPSLLRG